MTRSARLAAASLVDRDRSGRFGCHDMLRYDATERAEADEATGDRAVAVRRLLDWYMQGVDHAAGLLHPDLQRLLTSPPAPGVPPPVFHDRARALAWMEAERANLTAAIVHSAEHGPRSAAWLLADGLRGYFWLRPHPVDWLATARRGWRRRGTRTHSTAWPPCSSA